MLRCKKTWEQLHGVPLLPLASGRAGTFRKPLPFGGGDRYILASRRQQAIIPQLKNRFVHLKAARRLRKFFERDDFLQVGDEGVTTGTSGHVILSWKPSRFGSLLSDRSSARGDRRRWIFDGAACRGREPLAVMRGWYSR